MMNSYQHHQQQQQQQQQRAVMPPSLHATHQVSGYQQYGGAQSMGQSNNLGTNADGLVSYPTSHLYQNNAALAAAVPPAPPTPPGINDPVTKAVVDNILGKLPTKKNQVTHRCDVCDQDFSGLSVLDTHLAGAKHAKKLKSLEILHQLAASGQNFSQAGPGGNLRCEACGIDANSSQQLQTHLAGNKHKQRIQKLGGKLPAPVTTPMTMPPPPPPSLGSPATQPQVQTSSTPSTSMDPTKNYYCDICGVCLNSSQQMQQHMESKKHKDKEAGKQHSNKHHPYRRVPQARFQQTSTKPGKKRKQPTPFLAPLSSSFVPGSML